MKRTKYLKPVCIIVKALVNFYTKNLISGEGGALLINDEELIERSHIIREKGTNRTQFFSTRQCGI